jgi:hypothetical protein
MHGSAVYGNESVKLRFSGELFRNKNIVKYGMCDLGIKILLHMSQLFE